jgi:hypothetical protein
MNWQSLLSAEEHEVDTILEQPSDNTENCIAWLEQRRGEPALPNLDVSGYLSDIQIVPNSRGWKRHEQEVLSENGTVVIDADYGPPPLVDIPQYEAIEQMAFSPIIAFDREWLIQCCAEHIFAYQSGQLLSATELSENILSILSSKDDSDALQNTLCDLIGYENFDFLLQLVGNRETIVKNISIKVLYLLIMNRLQHQLPLSRELYRHQFRLGDSMLDQHLLTVLR